MDNYQKFRIRVSATKGKVQHDSYVDLISRSTLDKVESLVKMQLSRSLRFPYQVEIELLPENEFLYRAISNIFEVGALVCADFANLFYGC